MTPLDFSFPWSTFPPSSLRERVLSLVSPWINPGDRVVVAYSGGADSTFLLWMTWHLARLKGISPIGAYLNHRVRSDALDEEALARAALKSWGYPWVIGRICSPAPTRNVEHRLRRLRYAFLKRVRYRYQARWVLTAHTATDQAETLLLAMKRGGGGWMTGIPWAGRGLLRPLLLISREEIRKALKKAGFSWYEDPSNQDPRFIRNRLRPLLSLMGSPLPVARQSLIRQETLRILEQQGGMILTRTRLPTLPGSLRLDRTAQSAYDKILLSLALRTRFQALEGMLFLQQILDKEEAICRWKGYTIHVDAREVWIGPPIGWEGRPLVEGTHPLLSVNLVVQVVRSRVGVIPPGAWDLRPTRPGDRFGKVSLRSRLRRMGIPRWAWEGWPVIARDKDVIWALGLPPRYHGPGYHIEVKKHEPTDFGIFDLTRTSSGTDSGTRPNP